MFKIKAVQIFKKTSFIIDFKILFLMLSVTEHSADFAVAVRGVVRILTGEAASHFISVTDLLIDAQKRTLEINSLCTCYNLVTYMQGKIFNRIPLIKRLKWREYIGAKVFWGALSDKNNPYLTENAGSNVLMLFPEETNMLDPKVPYWEISLGIRSILRFFQIEYVRRMNYNDVRFGPKNSVRFGFTMMF